MNISVRLVAGTQSGNKAVDDAPFANRPYPLNGNFRARSLTCQQIVMFNRRSVSIQVTSHRTKYEMQLVAISDNPRSSKQ